LTIAGFGTLPKRLLRLTIPQQLTEIENGMHVFGNGPQLPDDFSGTVRLFPLPNLVLFPNVVQALHIFENRYCQMLAEAMKTDRLITMALLREGWQHDYQASPAIAPVVCIGKIVSHAETPDGTFNILLVGTKRARILREIPTDNLFRTAEVEILEDVLPDEAVELALREELMQAVHVCFAEGDSGFKNIELAASEIPLGSLIDLISYGFPFPIEVKQKLLEEVRVEERCKILLQELSKHRIEVSVEDSPPSRSARQFPPDFSNN
jgi:Lon protease-like protein